MYYRSLTSLQNSKRSAKNGRPRRRRRKLRARLKKRDIAPPIRTAPTITVPKAQSMVRCDKLSGCLGKRLVTLNCPQLGTSLLRLATRQLPSMARRALVLPKAWRSMRLPLAMPTTVQIVTAAVILSRHTARTRRCTSKVINLANVSCYGRLTFQQRMRTRTTSNNKCVKSPHLPCFVHKDRNF